MESYEIEICGIKRELPLIRIGRNTRLASFNILGDVELVDALADEMAKQIKKYKPDILVGPEVKVVPLIHGVAKRLGHKSFVVCRKSVKPYMISPVILKPLPHFPKHIKPLVIDGEDAKRLYRKKVVIVDDVVSTGVTMRMMDKMMEKVGADVASHFAAICQGEQFEKLKNLHFLSELPIFKSTT